MARLASTVLVAALFACHHGAPRAIPAPAPTGDAGVAADAPPPPPPPADAAPAITADECGAYVDHVLAVAVAAMRATRPADQVPTADQVAAIRTSLVASEPCRELTRAELTCALAAADQPALYACAGAAPR